MGYTPVPFSGFGGGLNLRDKADAVDESEAIDALNVLFTERGAVRQRDGYDNLTSSALTNRVASLEPYYTSSGTRQLLGGCGTRLEAVNTSGAVVASATGLTDAVWDFARHGSPGNEYAYAGNGTDTLRRWSGSAWSAPTATVDGVGALAMPRGGCLAVSPIDNRLVVGGFDTATGGPNGATTNPSYVHFSAAGNPESYTSTDFIQVTPGDGEKVMGVIAWRELVFIFKETRFFVVYGSSTDASGTTIFNYRPIDGGVGLASRRALCADESGVYFLSREGVHRTTGGEPEHISSSIEPIFSGGASQFYTGGTLSQANITNCAATAHDSKVYFAFPTTSANNRVLVSDPRYGWWSLYDIPASCLSTFRVGTGAPELVFGYASGSNHIGRHSSSYTNDDGTTITSYWRSGWQDMGAPEVKKIRESKVWGTGRASMALGHDFQTSTGTAELLNFTDPSAYTWNTGFWNVGHWSEGAGLVAQRRRIAIRGTVFSTYFRNATLNQPWAVHRLQHHVAAKRIPTVTESTTA